ncbi:cache domain-containing protein, partial [Plesiomonas shigelloides]|uniref:cache domain-containing protein n=1 Tax=Plesiomonas shigelloides TaxID=703 RepID=UPI00137D6BBA
MKTISLRLKILFSVALALLIAISLVSWRSYSSEKAILLQGAHEQVVRLGSLQAEQIKDWLQIRQQIIRATDSAMNSFPESALMQAQKAGHFQVTYFGRSDGSVFDSDPTLNLGSIDPRTRRWYQDAKQAKHLLVTKPYLDATTNNLVVTIASPTADGVVGGDLSIQTLINDISKMSLPADGVPLLLHRDGSIIATQNSTSTLRPATDIDNDLNSAQLTQLKNGHTLTPLYFEQEQRDKLVWATNIPDTDWELVLVLDKDTLEAPLQNLLLTQLGLALLVLVGSIG